MLKNLIFRNFFFWLFLILVLTLILLSIPLIGISRKELKKNTGNLEILRPFECGFNPFSKTYHGFCVQFLNIAILFLLVDLEIALIIPFFFNTSILEKKRNGVVNFIVFIGFFLILLLLIEWKLGGLKWKEEI